MSHDTIINEFAQLLGLAETGPAGDAVAEILDTVVGVVDAPPLEESDERLAELEEVFHGKISKAAWEEYFELQMLRAERHGEIVIRMWWRGVRLGLWPELHQVSDDTAAELHADVTAEVQDQMHAQLHEAYTFFATRVDDAAREAESAYWDVLAECYELAELAAFAHGFAAGQRLLGWASGSSPA